MLKCKVTRYNDGTIQVSENQGLYREALQQLGSPEKALRAWATSFTDGFQSSFRGDISQNMLPVFHGGSVRKLSVASKSSPLFVSQERSQAELYTRENRGVVTEFQIDPNKIAGESIAYEIINQLGLQSREEGWNPNELNLFELIDRNFDTALLDKDIQRLFSEIEKLGYGGIKFTDTNLRTERQDIENIVVFNPDIVSAGQQNPSFQDIVNYYSAVGSDLNTLSPAEVADVSAFMRGYRVGSLSELADILQKTFMQDGVYSIDTEAAIASGIWSPSELRELDDARMIDMVFKIQGHLAQKGDIYAEPEVRGFDYKDTSASTTLGAYPKVSAAMVDIAIQDLIRNPAELYDKVQELPYPEFVDKFYSNKNFAEQVQKKFSGLKIIPILRFQGDELVDTDISYYTTLKNTVLDNAEDISIEADIDYLEEIEEPIWDISLPEIQEIIRGIEKDLLKLNIDLIGLSKFPQDKALVLRILRSAERVLWSPSEENIRSLADNYTALLGTPINNTTYFAPIHPNYRDLNIIRLDTQLSDNTLFRDHGLIPIGDNLYHKVERGQVDQLYDYLADQVMSNDLLIPRTKAENYTKQDALKDLVSFVNSRDTGIDSEFQEEISLNQIAFRHLPIQAKPQEVAAVLDIKTDEQYLRSEFISDFYNYMLEEKQKNSQVWKNTLQFFTITDSDITLRRQLKNSIEGLKFEQELTDYIRLKKDSTLKYLIPASDQIVLEDALYINNRNLIPVLDTPVISEIDDLVAAESSANQFIKYKGIDYRRVISRDGIDVFARIGTRPDKNYYTGILNFNYDTERAQKFFDLLEKPQKSQSFSGENLKTLPLYSEQELKKIRRNTQQCG